MYMMGVLGVGRMFGAGLCCLRAGCCWGPVVDGLRVCVCLCIEFNTACAISIQNRLNILLHVQC